MSVDRQIPGESQRSLVHGRTLDLQEFGTMQVTKGTDFWLRDT